VSWHELADRGSRLSSRAAALADVAARYEHAATDEWQEPIGLGPGHEVPADGAPPVTTHRICTAMFAPHSEWHAGGQEGEASGGTLRASAAAWAGSADLASRTRHGFDAHADRRTIDAACPGCRCGVVPSTGQPGWSLRRAKPNTGRGWPWACGSTLTSCMAPARAWPQGCRPVVGRWPMLQWFLGIPSSLVVVRHCPWATIWDTRSQNNLGI